MSTLDSDLGGTRCGVRRRGEGGRGGLVRDSDSSYVRYKVSGSSFERQPRYSRVKRSTLSLSEGTSWSPS